MASEKISLLKMAVVGVLAIIGLLYLMKLVSWLLSLAIVGAALLGAGVIGYALARSLLGGDKEQAPALPAAKASDEIAFEFEGEEEDSDFMREMKALEAKERKVDAELRKLR